MISGLKVKVQTDTWDMCKDQQNAVLTDGETNAQKKEQSYVTLPCPAAVCCNVTGARTLELTNRISIPKYAQTDRI